jgi:hypothetical protein
MFLKQCFPLMPRATSRGVEKMLVQKLRQYLMLSLMLFESSEGGQSLVNDSSIDPSR